MQSKGTSPEITSDLFPFIRKPYNLSHNIKSKVGQNFFIEILIKLFTDFTCVNLSFSISFFVFGFN